MPSTGTPNVTQVLVSCVKGVREAMRDNLLGATQAGQRVSTNRAERVWRENVPAIEVYVLGEDVELSNEAPREYARTVRIAAELHVEERTENGARRPADDQLDELVAECLAVLCSSYDAWGTASDFQYVGAEYGWSADGARLLGAARLNFQAMFHDRIGEGDELRALTRTHLDWDVQGSPTTEPEAEDDIVTQGG